jgi:hypothetical protein
MIRPKSPDFHDRPLSAKALLGRAKTPANNRAGRGKTAPSAYPSVWPHEVKNAPTAATVTARRRTPTVEPLLLSTLLERLADPNVPEDELAPYLTVKVDPKTSMAPILMANDNVEQQADPAFVTRGGLGLGLLNRVYRVRRRRQFEQRLDEGNKDPILLAEGDSWFEYPIWLDDVIDHLNIDHNVFCLSAAGDELKGMVADAEYADYLDELIGGRGLKIGALLFSGGGNDIAGPDLSALLRPFEKGQSAEWHIEPVKFQATLAELKSRYETIFNRVVKRHPDLPILVHGYDYAIPLAPQGFSIPPKDGWLGEPLRSRGINDFTTQCTIVKLMTDGFYGVLSGLAGGNCGGRFAHVHLVDSRNRVKGRWADELHPTDEGFRDVADQFRKVLKAFI